MRAECTGKKRLTVNSLSDLDASGQTSGKGLPSKR